MQRRTVLQLLGSASIATLAGCSTVGNVGSDGGESPDESTPDLYLRNNAIDPHQGEFEVVKDGETVIRDRFELEADGSVSYEDPNTEPGSYTITVTTETGLEKSFTWEETHEPSTDSDGTHVSIWDGKIRIERVEY